MPCGLLRAGCARYISLWRCNRDIFTFLCNCNMQRPTYMPALLLCPSTYAAQQPLCSLALLFIMHHKKHQKHFTKHFHVLVSKNHSPNSSNTLKGSHPGMFLVIKSAGVTQRCGIAQVLNSIPVNTRHMADITFTNDWQLQHTQEWAETQLVDGEGQLSPTHHMVINRCNNAPTWDGEGVERSLTDWVQPPSITSRQTNMHPWKHAAVNPNNPLRRPCRCHRTALYVLIASDAAKQFKIYWNEIVWRHICSSSVT